MKTTLKILLLSSFIGLMTFSCGKEKIIPRHNSNITLYDKPLFVVQSYITGNWKLQYTYGGLWAHKSIDTIGSYMALSPYHIKVGNDFSGVFVDTTIVWIRAENLFSNTPYTYLLSYSLSGFSHEYIVNSIKNDTLMITDYNVGDGYSYYYTKY